MTIKYLLILFVWLSSNAYSQDTLILTIWSKGHVSHSESLMDPWDCVNLWFQLNLTLEVINKEDPSVTYFTACIPESGEL